MHASTFARPLPRLALTAALLGGTALSGAQAATVYADQFAGGSTAGWTLPSYASLSSLPTDSGGLTQGSQATWLKVDSGAAKTVDETASLALSGLTAGQTYTVGLQLFIGASWDGSAGYYGPDRWQLTVVHPDASTTALVDATFANGQQGINFGADSRQSYSPQTPLGGDALSFNRFTGASAFYSANQGGYYSQDYSVYGFSQGGATPTLSFVAHGSTATLNFQRLGVPSGDSSDEYWAVRGVTVTSAVPEASSVWLALSGLAVSLVAARRRR